MKKIFIALSIILGTVYTQASSLEAYVAASAVARGVINTGSLGAFYNDPIIRALNSGSGLSLKNCQSTNENSYQCTLNVEVSDSSGSQTLLVSVTLKQGLVIAASVK